MAFKKKEDSKVTADTNNVELTGTIKKMFCKTSKYCKFVLTVNKEKGFVNVLCHYFGDMTEKNEGDTIHIGGEIDTIKNEYQGNVTYQTCVKIDEYE